MSVALVSAWSAEYQPLADIVLPNRRAFCDKHGFDLLINRDWRGERGAQWARMKLAIGAIALYDTVLVMDIDAIITNFEYDFKWLAKTTSFLTATKDINGFNNGMMLLNQSVWTLDFMRRYWEAGARYHHHVNPEQTCMAHMLICEPQSAWGVVPQREFNSFKYGEYNYGPYPEGEWQEGDFILHLPSLPNKRRIEIFNEYLSSHG